MSKVKALVYQARSSLLADRSALGTPCSQIREQLSVARGGQLRRGPLRRHLRLCTGCRDFQLALSGQRQSLALVLPVAPSAGLAAAVLGHGAHGAAAATATTAHTAAAATGGSGLAASGGTAATATTTAVSAGAGAGTGVGVGASAGAGGGTGIGALLGGGLVTKLAVGGAVVALATASAVTVHSHPAQAIARHPIQIQHTSFTSTARRSVSAIGFTGSDSPRPRSPSPLALPDWTPPPFGPRDPGGPAGSESLPTGSESLPTFSASLSQPALNTLHGKGSKNSEPGTNTPALPKHRAAFRRKQAMLRRTERAAERRARRTRRARRKTLKHKPHVVKTLPHVVKTPKPKPVVAPAPAPAPAPPSTHHHKARPAPEPAPVQSSAPAKTNGTVNKSKETSGTETSANGPETAGGADPNPHAKKHLVESATEQPTEPAQPTNLDGAPAVTGVDVHPTPTPTETPTKAQTGGTHDASS